MKCLKMFAPVLAALMLVVSFSPAMADDDLISFNKAPASLIAKIQVVEISDTLAQAIVDYREAHGLFKTPKDVLKVPGMTDEIFEGLDLFEEEGDIVFEKAGGPGGMNAY